MITELNGQTFLIGKDQDRSQGKHYNNSKENYFCEKTFGANSVLYPIRTFDVENSVQCCQASPDGPNEIRTDIQVHTFAKLES
jgi:hypothetical protein